MRTSRGRSWSVRHRTSWSWCSASSWNTDGCARRRVGTSSWRVSRRALDHRMNAPIALRRVGEAVTSHRSSVDCVRSDKGRSLVSSQAMNAMAVVARSGLQFLDLAQPHVGEQEPRVLHDLDHVSGRPRRRYSLISASKCVRGPRLRKPRQLPGHHAEDIDDAVSGTQATHCRGLVWLLAGEWLASSALERYGVDA